MVRVRDTRKSAPTIELEPSFSGCLSVYAGVMTALGTSLPCSIDMSVRDCGVLSIKSMSRDEAARYGFALNSAFIRRWEELQDA